MNLEEILRNFRKAKRNELKDPLIELEYKSALSWDPCLEQRLSSSSTIKLKRQAQLVATARNRENSFIGLFLDIDKDDEGLKTCEICYGYLPEKPSVLDLKISDCEHQNDFCESCLLQFAIYRVTMFQQIQCPREDCDAVVDINGDFFRQLPLGIKKRYQRIHQFYLISRDSSLRLCPRQNCEGIASLNHKYVMVCNTCHKQYCTKCMLDYHEGQCEQYELDFFVHNLNYRQCSNCKMVIEKNAGCNHLTCLCGHQFCYVCGKNWSIDHHGNHDSQNNLIPPPSQVAQDNQNNQINQNNQMILMIRQIRQNQQSYTPLRERIYRFWTINCPFYGIKMLRFLGISLYVSFNFIAYLIYTIFFLLYSMVLGICCHSTENLPKTRWYYAILYIAFLFPLWIIQSIWVGIKLYFVEHCLDKWKNFFRVCKNIYSELLRW